MSWKQPLAVIAAVSLLALSPPDARGAAAAQPHEQPGFDHSLWNTVLSRYVDDAGLVDYAGIRKSVEFDAYLKRIERAAPSGAFDDADSLAFWINAYNALTIKAVLDTLPEDEAKWPEYKITEQKVDGQSIWKGRTFAVGGGKWTLDGIEHEILRKQPGLRDPRIHVVLVCAARGCPPLWNAAYDGNQIDPHLERAMRRFVSNSKQCAIDVAKRTITISKVFEWYGSDFTDRNFSPRAASIPAFLADYVEDASTAAALRSGEWAITYFEYDWRLNVQR